MPKEEREQLTSTTEKEQKMKEAVTTVDDIGRLLHVRFDVSLVTLWTEVLSPKTRAAIDLKVFSLNHLTQIVIKPVTCRL